MSQKVGSITFDPNHVIGTGSSSTVYKGTFGFREVAVKKVDKSHTKLIATEIKLLQRSDQHPNIIRYFVSEEDDQHYFIALELCICTLREYVNQPAMKTQIPIKSVIEQMLAGLGHLHTLSPSIVHRDIKPTNVLLMQNATGHLEVKISDFGFAKQMQVSGSQMSIVPDESIYWKVPEMKQGRYNLKSDVFSMGCLIFFLVNDGNISVVNEMIQFNWKESTSQTCDGECVIHLVRVMARNNPEQRPPIKCLLGHPFFWTNQKILTFLVKVADRIKDGDGYEPKRFLEEQAEQIIGSSWLSRLEPEIERSLIFRGRSHGYGGERICELLRALRNKEAHYDEMNGEAKRSFGSLPDGFAAYWINKFPRLLLHVYFQIYRSGLRSEENFSQFYPNQQDCQTLFDI